MVTAKTYLGIKGSVYYTPLNNLTETGFSGPAGSILIVGNNSIRTQLQPIYNIDGVLGYEVWEHFLPYFEAGISFADIHNNYTFKRTRTNLATSSIVKYQYGPNINNYKTGFNVGVGANYQPHPHWIFGSELVYNYIGKTSGNDFISIPGTTDIETQYRNTQGNNVALFCTASYLFNM